MGGLAAIGVELSSDARRRIDDHVRLLLAWNAAINLTAIRDPAAIAIRHVVDSLTALPVLAAMHPTRLLDLGSGGGYPGLPLVAALPGSDAVLVESVGKKVRFLRAVVDATGLGDRVGVEATRAEDLARRDGEASEAVVVARAVGPLAELVELAMPLAGPGGRLVAWKGVGAVGSGTASELAAARRALEAISPGGAIDVVPAIPEGAGPILEELRDHRLVVVSGGLERAAATWPRDPAARRRRPW